MTLTQFIKLFPNLEPPLTLTEESIFEFSKRNKLINEEMARSFFNTIEEDFATDDDREYVPCFRLSISEEYHSLVYWRAKALNYEYYLINLNKKGELLDRRLIGGLIATKDSILRMATSIDINNVIYIVASLSDQDGHIDELETQTYSLETLPDGSIISS